MLAPLSDMERFREKSLELFPESSFGIQTNLVYKLTKSRLSFLSSLKSFGISWDHDIRFEHLSQKLLWEQNVKELSQYGLQLTLVVSMSTNLIKEKKAIDIVSYAYGLGFKHILFERITSNGNAKLNKGVLPGNQDADKWTYQMYKDTLVGNWQEKIDNMLLATIAEGIVNVNNIATSCRSCEQTMLTINADGTLAGCPNSAPEENWGHLSMEIFEVLKSSDRMKSIMCEATKNPICYTCEYLPVCNGGCHRLDWQGDLCPAPKNIFKEGLERPKNFEVLLWQ